MSQETSGVGSREIGRDGGREEGWVGGNRGREGEKRKVMRGKGMRERGKGRRKMKGEEKDEEGGEKEERDEGRRRKGNRVIISSVMSLHLDSFLIFFLIKGAKSIVSLVFKAS